MRGDTQREVPEWARRVKDRSDPQAAENKERAPGRTWPEARSVVAMRKPGVRAGAVLLCRLGVDPGIEQSAGRQLGQPLIGGALLIERGPQEIRFIA